MEDLTNILQHDDELNEEQLKKYLRLQVKLLQMMDAVMELLCPAQYRHQEALTVMHAALHTIAILLFAAQPKMFI